LENYDDLNVKIKVIVIYFIGHMKPGLPKAKP